MKQFLFAIFAVALVVVPGGLTYAASNMVSDGFSVSTAAGSADTLTNATFYSIVERVMNWLLGFIGVLGVVAFVIAGIMYLTAAGDEGQTEKAKSIMMYAIIGLVVALIGLVVVNAVTGLVGNGDNGSAQNF